MIMTSLQRYPPSSDRSLRVFSAADRLLIEWAVASSGSATKATPLTVVHDRFGAVALSVGGAVDVVGSYHSQEEALRRNASGHLPAIYPLTAAPPAVSRAVVRIPKSIALWEYYLAYLAGGASATTTVAAGFMTRHFTPQWLAVAGRYATEVTQSRARQKGRLLLLSGFKESVPTVPLQHLDYGGRTYRQYAGVFSGKHIDHATQFLLAAWSSQPQLRDLPAPARILDIACGNGVIGDQLLLRYPEARLTALDDFSLAVASARLNLPPARSEVMYAHTLRAVPDASQDLVVINPPFHFGYENNIEVSLGLFAQVPRVLTKEGSLVIVANCHLNYATHLHPRWQVSVVAESEKYIVYHCRAPRP